MGRSKARRWATDGLLDVSDAEWTSIDSPSLPRRGSSREVAVDDVAIAKASPSGSNIPGGLHGDATIGDGQLGIRQRESTQAPQASLATPMAHSWASCLGMGH